MGQNPQDSLGQDPDSHSFELAKSFHSQFAENQNHHQTIFLQLLTLLLTIFAGNGYLYSKLIDDKSFNFIVETIYFFLLISSAILTLGMALVLNMGYNFRRDQLATCLIRKRAKAMTNCIDTTYFLASFNPSKHTGLISWVPGFQFIFFLFLFLLKPFLITGVVFGSMTQPCSCTFTVLMSISLFISILSITLDMFLFCFFKHKWTKFAHDNSIRID